MTETYQEGKRLTLKYRKLAEIIGDMQALIEKHKKRV